MIETEADEFPTSVGEASAQEIGHARAFLTEAFAAEGRANAEMNMAEEMVGSTDWQAGIDLAATALFLDVDGTLLGFKDRPGDVIADDELRHLLEALRAATNGALALVSGRQISDLDRIMSPLVLAAGGTHGAELRWPDGHRQAIDDELLADIRPLAEAFVAERQGLMYEDKGAALCIHFRLCPAREGEVSRFLEEVVAGRDLMVQHGKMVAEIKSNRSSKGEAIERFMREPPFVGRVPLFAGDDLTDEHGFAKVNALGGLSIKVGEQSEHTVARYRLAGVDEVRIFLNRLLLAAQNVD